MSSESHENIPSAEKDQIERVRVILAEYADGVRGAVSSLLAIDAATTDDTPATPPGKADR